MAIQIRRGVFETNSSSVHALSFMTADEYNSVMYGDAVIAFAPVYVGIGDADGPVVLSREEAIAGLRNYHSGRFADEYTDEQLLRMGYCYFEGSYGDVDFAPVPGNPNMYAFAGDLSNDL